MISSITVASLLTTLAHITVAAASPPPPVLVTFPEFGTNQDISGSLEFLQIDSGVEIISSGFDGLRDFPAGQGPFLWHIHVDPIPNGGSCLDAGAHFDPDAVGEQPPCNPNTPEKCQFGDLAGKYGRITADPFVIDRVDSFLSFGNANKGFFLGRSVVIHAANGTRIACANIGTPRKDLEAASSSTASTATTTAGASSTASATKSAGVQFGSDANKLASSRFGWVVALLAFGLGVILH